MEDFTASVADRGSAIEERRNIRFIYRGLHMTVLTTDS